VVKNTNTNTNIIMKKTQKLKQVCRLEYPSPKIELLELLTVSTIAAQSNDGLELKDLDDVPAQW